MPPACAEDPEGPRPELRGQWGGAHFGLEVTGTAAALFDCATGTLEVPIMVDGRGHFAAAGDYTREIGPAALTHPAYYEGWVLADRVILTGTITDTLSSGGRFDIGPFLGTLGKAPEVAFCQ